MAHWRFCSKGDDLALFLGGGCSPAARGKLTADDVCVGVRRGRGELTVVDDGGRELESPAFFVERPGRA